jgi:hypothetical protein
MAAADRQYPFMQPQFEADRIEANFGLAERRLRH